MTKNEILEKIRSVNETTARNSMGCSENWYNSYYALRETFTPEELDCFSLEELKHLLKLADSIADGLY